MKRSSVVTVIIASLFCLPILSTASELTTTQENKKMESTFKDGKNLVTFKSQGVSLSGLLYTPA